VEEIVMLEEILKALEERYNKLVARSSNERRGTLISVTNTKKTVAMKSKVWLFVRRVEKVVKK
jgi:hypothetical protein